MALKSTSSIEDIEMWYLKTLERLEKIQIWKNLNSLSVEVKENKAPWKKGKNSNNKLCEVFETKNKKAIAKRRANYCNICTNIHSYPELVQIRYR